MHLDTGPAGDSTTIRYDPSWIDELWTVTPDDIHRVTEQARHAGCDPEDLDFWLGQAVSDAGGTIEALARTWTFRNRRAALRRQLERSNNRWVGR